MNQRRPELPGSHSTASAWIAFLRLVRFPNVFTVIADIVMGFLFVHPSLRPPVGFAMILGSSICLYWAGMILNDVCDVQQDRRERPERPLPSGAISLATAAWWAVGLLIAGIGLGWGGGFAFEGVALPWRSGVIATLIAACVVAYDCGLKRTLCGPFVMGLCRAGNVLLGMSLGDVIYDYATPILHFDAAQLAVAGGLGLYVAGITLLARDEAAENNSPRFLWLGGLVMLGGLVGLASMTTSSVVQAGRYDLAMPHHVWPLIVLFLSFPIFRRIVIVAIWPTSERIQQTVKTCILSLIVLDAAICLAVRPPWMWSILILSLLLPSVILGRWFYAT